LTNIKTNKLYFRNGWTLKDEINQLKHPNKATNKGCSMTLRRQDHVTPKTVGEVQNSLTNDQDKKTIVIDKNETMPTKEMEKTHKQDSKVKTNPYKMGGPVGVVFYAGFFTTYTYVITYKCQTVSSNCII